MLEAAVKYPADLSLLEVSSKSVNIFLNCRPDSISEIYAKTPMTADQMQMGLGQNFGEFLVPKDLVVSLDRPDLAEKLASAGLSLPGKVKASSSQNKLVYADL